MITTQMFNQERKTRECEYNDDLLNQTKTRENAPYREAVGSLLYLAGATRPDSSYAVNVLSWHQVSPSEKDWKMIKRVFRYLKGTKSLYLRYSGEADSMETFSDASFADCKDARTTCGFVVKIVGDAICWRTHKQPYVSLSTCEAEYVTMSEACREVVSLYNSIRLILDSSLLPITLWCDNKAAGACVEVNGGNKLRYMVEIKRHYVKECVERKIVKVKWVCSREQIADIFTKPLPFELIDT